MKHPDVSRVILTRIEGDGASDFQVLSIAAKTLLDDVRNPVFAVSQLWGTTDGIGSVGAGINPEQVIDPWFPGPGGIRFRFFTFLPSVPRANATQREEPLLLENAQSEGLSNFAEAFDPNRPGMHVSDSVDFVLILSGQVILEMERREVLVKQGDIVIMRGAWHNWRNETDEPCTVASVMVGANRRQA